MTSYRLLQLSIACILFVLAFVLHKKNNWLASHNEKLKLGSTFFAISLLFVVFRKWFYILPIYVQLLSFALIGVCFYKFLRLDYFRKHFIHRFNKIHLACIRILVCSSLLLLVFLHDITTTLIIPLDFVTRYEPLGFLLDILPYRNYEFLWWLRFSSAVCLVASILGIKTRISLLLAALFYTVFYYIMIVYTHFFHSGFIPLQLLYLLIFLPSGDALSIDSKYKKTSRSNVDYGYAVLVIISTYSLLYLATGLSKLYVDPFWANHYNLKKFILEDSLDMISFFDLDLAAKYIQLEYSRHAFTLIGVIGLATEFFAPMILFLPGLVWLVPLAIFSLHSGIAILQEFLFEDAIFISIGLFLIFYKLKSKFNFKLDSDAKEKSKSITVIGSGFAGLILTAWLCGWHFFPISSVWGMYAVDTNKTEGASYSKVFLVTNDGNKIRTDLTDQLTFATGGKWRNLTEHPRAVKIEYIDKLKKLYKNYAELYNRNLPFDKQIHHAEIELWIWWHFADPKSPTFGAVRDDIIKVYFNDDT